MEPRDCSWCGSARSIEYGLCQVCLMRFPEDALEDEVVVVIDPPAVEIQEASSPDPEAATGA